MFDPFMGEILTINRIQSTGADDIYKLPEILVIFRNASGQTGVITAGKEPGEYHGNIKISHS